MRGETYFDDEDFDPSDDDPYSGELEPYEAVVINVKDKKRRALETRRKIERLMERRRRRELEEDYF